MKNRTFGMLSTGLAVALMSAGVAFAQPAEKPAREDAPKRERPQRDAERPAREGERRGPGAEGPIRMLYRDITLSEEQRAKVRELAEAHKDQHDAFAAKLREAAKKARDAREAGDKEAAEAAMEELRKIASHPPILDLLDGYRDVLTTDADKAQFDKNVEEVVKHVKERVQGRREERREGRPEGDRPQRKGDGEGERPQRKRDGEGKSDAELDI